MVSNPVQAVREDLKLTRLEFAIACGISYAEIFKAENGYTQSLNANLASFLKNSNLSDDPDTDYQAWRETRRASMCSSYEQS